MLVNVNTTTLDGRYYAHFEFRYDEQAAVANPETPAPLDVPGQIPDEQGTPAPLSVDQEVTELRQQHNDWVYLIPEFKYEILSQTLENLTRETSE
jgi:hypothetical protein